MSLIIQKYGGASLQSPQHIKEIAKRISKKKQEGHELVVVVSAMGNHTDELLQLAHQISPMPDARELDMLLTAGERISMALISMALHNLGEPAISLTGSQSGIVTDNAHMNAKILDIKASRIQEALEEKKIVIVAGFQGVSLRKEVTTLGRGGSDVTAVALAVRLQAERCEFYKDVDGLYTEDPKVTPHAKKLELCTYEEVLTVLSGGSQVLHRDAILLAQKASLPLYVASSFSQTIGTVIH